MFAGGGSIVLASSLLSAAQAQTTGGTTKSAPPKGEAAALKAMETWAGSLALQAATYAAPLVAMYNLRASVAFGPKSKAQPGTIWRFEDIAAPALAAESGYVSPNVNVVYGFGFADLGQEPYILTAPDSHGRYYMIEVVDMWTNAFAYPVGGPSGYKGGKFAFVGPGWEGSLPDGVTRIDCPTRWIEMQPRVNVKNEADLPGALAVLRAIKLQGLAEFTTGAALKAPIYDYEVPKMNPKVASSLMDFDDPMQFWSIFAVAMNESPPPRDEIDTVLPQFRYLGIEFGKPWNPKGVNPLYLAVMKKVAQELGPTITNSMPIVGKLKNGWIIPPANTGNAGKDFMSRCVVAIFGLTANTPDPGGVLSGPAGCAKPASDRHEEVHHDVQRFDGFRPVGPAGILVADDVRCGNILYCAESTQPLYSRQRQYIQEEPGRIIHDLHPAGQPRAGQGIELAAGAGGAILLHPAKLRAGTRGRRRPERSGYVRRATAGGAGWMTMQPYRLFHAHARCLA